MKFDKRILHVHQQARTLQGRPVGAPMPTWYDKGDGNLKAMRSCWKEAADLEKRRELEKAERFRPPANVPLIAEKRSRWPFRKGNL